MYADGNHNAVLLLLLVTLSSLAGLAGCNRIQPDLSSAPIKHVVVIMQENRTFDNFFHGFSRRRFGAERHEQRHSRAAIACPAGRNVRSEDHTPIPPGGRPGTTAKWMDLRRLQTNPPLAASSYVPPSQIQPYWTLATRYTLADRMFQSNTGTSFTAHQYMIAGQSGQADEDPFPNTAPWGCDAPAGTTVTLVGPNGTDLPGVFPCFDYQTMADLLDARGLTWRYYAPANSTPDGSTSSAYEAIRHIFYGAEWQSNNISPQTQVLYRYRQRGHGAGHLDRSGLASF